MFSLGGKGHLFGMQLWPLKAGEGVAIVRSQLYYHHIIRPPQTPGPQLKEGGDYQIHWPEIHHHSGSSDVRRDGARRGEGERWPRFWPQSPGA